MTLGAAGAKDKKMPSPFPGMDPFIENQIWEDFHHEMISEIRAALVPQARPRYTVRVEERMYIEHYLEQRAAIRPDVAVIARETMTAYQTVSAHVTDLTLPIPETIIETFLVLRERESGEVVTVIEVVSPANKRAGSDGRREYLAKRESILQSAAHLVELDLLRGGERLPTIEPLPAADYYAFISRARHRPTVQVYSWSLRAPLPTLPIPLDNNDPDLTLHLQEIFARVYDRAGYDCSLDYKCSIQPPLAQADADWITARLQAQTT